MAGRVRGAPARFLWRHRLCLGALAAAFAALCVFWLARGSPAAMAWWVERVSMPFKRAVSAAADLLPVSVCELGATLLILLVLARLLRAIVLTVQRQKDPLPAWALHTGTIALWIYVGASAFWGTQYYVPGFAARAGMSAPPVAAEELLAVTEYFRVQVNAAAGAVPRDADGLFAVDKAEILGQGGAVYTGMEAEYPFLAGPVRRAKPALYSKIMSAAGFTGYLCPLLGESTLNVDCPAVFLPATIAHEFAHQRGVATEQEANFCGVEASVTSGLPAYVYSGWLFGYLYLSNALYETDPAAAGENYAALCREAQADMADNNAYWKEWEGPAKEAGEVVYNNFLKGYDQPLGMRSYGACVDLLVEKYAEAAGASGAAAT